MTLAQMANIGEFLGGITVLVTLIYLALQVRQASSLSRANMGFAITSEFNRSHEILLSNPDLMKVLLKAEQNKALTILEDRMIASYGRRLINIWIAGDQAYDHESLSEFLIDAMKDDVVGTCKRLPPIAITLDGFLERNPDAKKLAVFERYLADRRA